MKIKNEYIVIGIIALAGGYYLWNKYQSRKAIVDAKDKELAPAATVEIPKMYIRSGVNIPVQSGVKTY